MSVPIRRSDVTQHRTSQCPPCATSVHSLNVRFCPILLKKSKIAELRKSRECRVLVISAAARLCRTDASVGGRFCVNRCSRPENFRSLAKKDFFNTIVPQRTSVHGLVPRLL